MKKLCESFNSATVRKGEAFQIALMTVPQAGQYWQPELLSGRATLLSNDMLPYQGKSWLDGFAVAGGCMTQSLVYRADESGEIDIRVKSPIGVAPMQFKIKVT